MKNEASAGEVQRSRGQSHLDAALRFLSVKEKIWWDARVILRGGIRRQRRAA